MDEQVSQVAHFPFREQARKHLTSAEELLCGEGQQLVYPCLELHLAIEAIVYETLQAYEKNLSPDVAEAHQHWQPNKVLELLSAHDPLVDTSLRVLTRGMDGLAAEDSAVLHAGLVSSDYVTVDDTGARHSHNPCYATQIGGPNFTVFRTTPSKSRLNFLSLLRGNYQDYVLNDAAFDYLDQRYGTDPAIVAGLRTRAPQHFCNEVPFLHYLANKGIDIFDTEKIRPLAEAGIWGAIRHHGLIGNAIIVSDDAGQFRVGTHALCWVHSERLLQKLMPTTPGQKTGRDHPGPDLAFL